VSTEFADNAAMAAVTQEQSPEPVAVPLPQRGRIWVVLLLGIAALAIGYAIVEIATRPAGSDVVRVAGISDTQRTFGGIPQEGDRLGSADAPISIQIFNDLQCSSCRDDFLSTIPTLTEDYARPGDVKLLMRHYSVAQNPLELGFYGAEAAAEQGYGWQYTYLFFRNQDEAERFGIGDALMDSLAGSIGELDVPEWQRVLDRELGSDGPITRRLEGYDQLGVELGIRTGQAAIVSGPGDTRTLQDGPTLAQIEAAIEAVR
jgi:protein-disulfide isomerase